MRWVVWSTSRVWRMCREPVSARIAVVCMNDVHDLLESVLMGISE